MADEDQPRTEAATAILRRDILNGVLAPDQPLRLMALSKRYGIGYTPLREALSRLEAAGLAVLNRNRGYRVAPVSLQELEDLEQARTVVETALLEDAIAQGDLAWESAVVSAHYRLVQAAQAVRDDAEKVPVWMEAHDAFHTALSGAARSSWLKSFQRQVSDQLRRHHQAFLFNPGLGRADGDDGSDGQTRRLLEEALALDHHTALKEAALARDAVRALALMRAHVQLTLSVYRSVAAQRSGTAPKQVNRGAEVPRSQNG